MLSAMDAVICHTGAAVVPYKTTNVQMATSRERWEWGSISHRSALRDRGGKSCVLSAMVGLMTGNEMIATVERNLPVRFIVANNASYGTIRLYQERNHPDRRWQRTFLIDFVLLAEAYGLRASK